jgi:hypothetical protein
MVGMCMLDGIVQRLLDNTVELYRHLRIINLKMGLNLKSDPPSIGDVLRFHQLHHRSRQAIILQVGGD